MIWNGCTSGLPHSLHFSQRISSGIADTSCFVLYSSCRSCSLRLCWCRSLTITDFCFSCTSFFGELSNMYCSPTGFYKRGGICVMTFGAEFATMKLYTQRLTADPNEEEKRHDFCHIVLPRKLFLIHSNPFLFCFSFLAECFII